MPHQLQIRKEYLSAVVKGFLDMVIPMSDLLVYDVDQFEKTPSQIGPWHPMSMYRKLSFASTSANSMLKNPL